MLKKAVVCHSRTVKYVTNKLSGHSWPEYTYTGKFHVSGGQTSRFFNSEKSAQAWCDYINESRKEVNEHYK